ncbi:MAG: class I SAM-dependent methyltransferase [Candidatus Sumerlaeia bacterium]|nr:class I SAM-dependent methyltransferase [Candidatus Sumerlaeia bacterium]
MRFADAFERIFPAPDAEEAGFYGALLRGVPAGARALDLGCGRGRLAGVFPLGVRATGCDLGADWLAPAAGRYSGAVLGDMRGLPFRDGIFRGAVSGLLVLNHAGSAEGFLTALRECARILAPGGTLVAEIAAARAPRSLQGLAETHEGADGARFHFRYADALASDERGATLRAGIDIDLPEGSASEDFDLFVPALGALPGTLAEAGLALEALFAPHDLSSRTLEPPHDCLRAVLLARRGATFPVP